MKVTNEQAQGVVKADYVTGNLVNLLKDYASDLLESRAQNAELLAALKWVQEVQKRNYGSGMGLHMDMLDFPRLFDSAIAKMEGK